MKYGLTESQIQYLNQTVVHPLRARGARVWLFGSRARGDHKPFSDIDIMIESQTDLRRIISEIQETLMESSFPFKVDLVQDRDFAESYRPSYLHDRIELV